MTNLKDDDYTLVEGSGWFKVGGFAVRIHKTDEGVICDIYEDNKEAEAAIASCYAYDAELGTTEGECGRCGSPAGVFDETCPECDKRKA